MLTKGQHGQNLRGKKEQDTGKKSEVQEVVAFLLGTVYPPRRQGNSQPAAPKSAEPFTYRILL